MSFPTVQGKPWFDTTGYNAQMFVKVDNDPPAGITVTQIRIWGFGDIQSKCKNVSKNMLAAITVGAASGIPLPWDNNSPQYAFANWVHWDQDDDYLHICVEVSLSDGKKLYKVGVWETVPEGDYLPSDLTDCAESQPVVVKKSVIIYPQPPSPERRTTRVNRSGRQK